MVVPSLPDRTAYPEPCPDADAGTALSFSTSGPVPAYDIGAFGNVTDYVQELISYADRQPASGKVPTVGFPRPPCKTAVPWLGLPAHPV